MKKSYFSFCILIFCLLTSLFSKQTSLSGQSQGNLRVQNWHADTLGNRTVVPTAVMPSPPIDNQGNQVGRDLSIIAPHIPLANVPDYAHKKELWILNYPDEYLLLLEPR